MHVSESSIEVYILMVFEVHNYLYSALLVWMATRSKEFMEFDVDWDERTLSEGRYGTVLSSTMYPKLQ